MTNTALNTNLRNSILRDLMEFAAGKYETDTLSCSTSSFTFPVVDEEGNEKFAKISISIPRGTRNGEGGYDPYDGYAAAEDYQIEQNEKAEKKAAAEAKKQAKIAKDQKAREEKKALAEANKGLKELRKIDITPKGE